MSNQVASLKDRWDALLAENPKMRIRNAADALEVSEAELLALKCGDTVTRLKPEFTSILKEIEGLGKVMALTRNDAVVHERKGVYLNPELENPHVGLFVGADIDLRIFFSCWAHVFAVQEEARGQMRRSIQFFSKWGEAVHKIYLVPQSDEKAYAALIEKYIHDDQGTSITVEAKPEPSKDLPDNQIDVEPFQQEWRDLKDTHDFFGMLRKYKLGRVQALRLAPEGDYAVKVDNTATRRILDAAKENEVPIMVFVGNKGMIQIHSGPVNKLLEHGTWYNVMDPDFNLHINEEMIANSWVVRKPTEDGTVTALEVYDEHNELIVQFFGARKPGIPEREDWRAIVGKVESDLILN